MKLNEAWYPLYRNLKLLQGKLESLEIIQANHIAKSVNPSEASLNQYISITVAK